MSGDGPSKIATPAEPLDEIILGEDDETSPAPPVEAKPAPPPVPPPVERIERASASPPGDAKEKKRSKLTLRIPDDEVSRPNLPATTPMGGIPALRGSERPDAINASAGGSRPPSAPEINPDSFPLEPMRGTPILNIGSPDDTLELPPRKKPSIPAPGIDAGSERGWTPYQPPVDGAENGSGSYDQDGERLDRDTPTSTTGPVSEEIPIETDLDDESDISNDLTRPRMPASLDSEEIKLDDAERVTDPGELPEVSPEDLVSVESIPNPGHGAPPPPPEKGKKLEVAKGSGSVTAAQIIASASTPAPAPVLKAPSQAPPAAPSAPIAPAPTPSAPPVQSTPAAQAVAVPVAPTAPHVPQAPAPQAAAPATPTTTAHAAVSRSPLVFMPPAGALAPPPMNESAANRKKIRPWWEELFNDDYIRTMAKVNDAQIGAECTFIEESLGCEAGAMVLDLACGTGRHAVELAKRGYQVVGFDLSLSMLARASDEAQEHGQKINFVQGDMREMTFEETFDGIFSWNTSFGFFDEEKNNAVVAKVHRALKKGGQFLLDVVNRDYIVRMAPSLAWFEGDGCICMDEMQIDFITSRMRVKRTLMMDDGRTKEIEYSIRVYALHELGKMLHDNGFRVAEVSGRTGTPGVFFGCESPRTLILAEKR